MCPFSSHHHSTSDSVKRLIFACSGASDVGHIADLVARELDASGLGKMSCLAGLSAQVPGILKDAESADEIVAIDGCPLECVRKTMEAAGIKDFEHVRLTEFGLEKGKSPADEKRVAMAVHHTTQRLRGDASTENC